MTIQWSQVDAWIFLAVALGGSRLRSTEEEADRLNHAVPYLEEFDTTIGKLVGAGLLEYRDGHIRVNKYSRELHRYSHDTDRSPWDPGGALSRALEGLSKYDGDPAPPPSELTRWSDALSRPKKRNWLRLGRRYPRH